MDDDDGDLVWEEPDYDPGSDQQFRASLTTIDLGEADAILTPSWRAAEWAREHGYQIEEQVIPGMTGHSYMIKPGDQGV